MRGWLRLHPDVIEYSPDISAVRDEGNDAHLPTTDRAQKREHLLDAAYQPQWTADKFIGFCAAFVAAVLAVLFGTSVHQFATRLAQPLHGKRRAMRSSAANAPGQRGRGLGCTHRHPPRNRRVGRPHLLGVTTLQQAPAHEGAQDAAAQICLRLTHSIIRINPAGRVENDARRGGCWAYCRCGYAQ